jgi:hypothetical protein
MRAQKDALRGPGEIADFVGWKLIIRRREKK